MKYKTFKAYALCKNGKLLNWQNSKDCGIAVTLRKSDAIAAQANHDGEVVSCEIKIRVPTKG